MCHWHTDSPGAHVCTLLETQSQPPAGNINTFCVFSCIHRFLDDNDCTLKCIDILKEWANLVREQSGVVPYMLFMDSYYLTNDGQAMLKSGTHVTAWNKRTKL
eukprot:9976128-Ditylum_brightwellii.AAC.1